MGVSQFKQPGQPASRPTQPTPVESPRWEIGIDRNRVAAFIGVALIAGFGFGYLAARFLLSSKGAAEKPRAAATGPGDSSNSGDRATNAAAPGDFHKVTRIVRADTIEAEGLGGIRLIGVVGPPGAGRGDVNSAPAQAAMKFATDTLFGKDIRIELEPLISGGRDESGNTFAYVFTRDGALFNEEMIKQGDAFAKVDQPSKFLERFRAAEREAMENMRGVWSPADKSSKGSLLASSGDKTDRRAPATRLPDPLAPSIPPATLDARLPGTLASDPVIFVSAADRMYHKEGCQYLGKKGRPMTLSEAKAAGYVACGRCFASTVMKAP